MSGTPVLDNSDRYEDVFTVRHRGVSPVSVSVDIDCSAAGSDLDLIVFTDDSALVGTSTDPDCSEAVTFSALPGTRYYIGVSWFSGPATSYTLRLR